MELSDASPEQDGSTTLFAEVEAALRESRRPCVYLTGGIGWAAAPAVVEWRGATPRMCGPRWRPVCRGRGFRAAMSWPGNALSNCGRFRCSHASQRRSGPGRVLVAHRVPSMAKAVPSTWACPWDYASNSPGLRQDNALDFSRTVRRRKSLFECSRPTIGVGRRDHGTFSTDLPTANNPPRIGYANRQDYPPVTLAPSMPVRQRKRRSRL